MQGDLVDDGVRAKVIQVDAIAKHINILVGNLKNILSPIQVVVSDIREANAGVKSKLP